jgi:hypothetical protein
MGAVVQCTHAGVATPTVTSPRVLVSGMPVATLASPYVIAGCALTGTGAPPCVTGQWVVGATRVLVNGQPVLIQTGQGIGLPPGTPLLAVSAQTRVVAT